MSKILTDAEIDALIAEPKRLPSNWKLRLSLRKPKTGLPHWGRNCDISGDNGNQYRIILRSGPRLLDFMIGLALVNADQSVSMLLRYDGKAPSEHTNKMEHKQRMPGSRFRNEFHIHRATERYQLAGLRIDDWAEITNRYGSFDSALRALIKDAAMYVDGENHGQGLFTDIEV